MELNRVFLIGNLTRDPESRFLQSGMQVCKMGLAVNHRSSSKDKEKEETLFIDVEAWAKTAELCSQYLRKGSQVLIEGRLKLDAFTTKEGEKRSKILVVADRVQFGARPQGQGGEGGGARGGDRPQNAPYQGGGGARRDAGKPAPPRESSDEDFGASQERYADQGTEDDLPF